MRRIVGLDLNGWRDFAARDWSPEDLEAKDDALRIIDGGIEGVAVRDLDDRWLGGPQAVLAPHGRGPGWGRIGAPDDIAGAALFLCGRGGAYTTGAILPLDGGIGVETGHELFEEH